ncbi:triacylglycerol lipase [Actinophytocola xanthii]|uniref:Triacylglycerol lipase n=1 Tax=Actinophytocola xanthii TaxID=1912961 RepID=A0A1Q8CUG3_9PSEU|nr:triacylglycerol lipase [Actinophytocola xanthii]
MRAALFAALTAALALIGTQPAQAAAGPYVALGDSYSSGVGARNYYPDSGSCYRSPQSFPVLVAQQLGAPLTFPACSSADIADVLNQLGSLNASTAYVTVSAGGNDAGFAAMVTQCALPWPATCTSQVNNANTFIRDTLPGRLDNLYRQIRTRAPGARVAVAGYPRLFNGEECNALARISPAEQSALNASADLLATTIAGRAAAHGFAYVDVRSAFVGHAVCDDAEWINGLSNPVVDSYHPNVAGHASYAAQVRARLTAG